MNWSGILLGMIKPTVLAERERLVYCQHITGCTSVPWEETFEGFKWNISGGGGQGLTVSDPIFGLWFEPELGQKIHGITIVLLCWPRFLLGGFLILFCLFPQAFQRRLVSYLKITLKRQHENFLDRNWRDRNCGFLRISLSLNRWTANMSYSFYSFSTHSAFSTHPTFSMHSASSSQLGVEQGTRAPKTAGNRAYCYQWLCGIQVCWPPRKFVFCGSVTSMIIFIYPV